MRWNLVILFLCSIGLVGVRMWEGYNTSDLICQQTRNPREHIPHEAHHTHLFLHSQSRGHIRWVTAAKIQTEIQVN